jgi:cytochrome c oxidase cbb3-type subunit 3
MSMLRFVRPLSIFVLTAGCLSAGVIARQAAPVVDAEAAKLENPVAESPASIAAGKKAYDANCAACHGAEAEGGLIISVIEDQGGTQPPNLVDDQWDWGATDGEIFTVIKKGVPPEYFMAPWEGRMPDTDMWHIVNYLRALAKKTA